MLKFISRSNPRLRDVVIPALWVLIGFGVFMRIWDLGGEGLRLDESQSVWQAMHSLEFIKAYMLKNVHLPLHNSLLHVWMLFFGQSELAVRMLALIPGILAIPAFYFLSREFLNSRGALFSTTIASLSPFWVWYSREIRMYSMLTFITVLSYYAYVKILKEDRLRWYVMYTLVNLVGIYTHYFFFLILFVHFIFFLLTWKVSFTDRNKSEKTKVFGRLTAVAFVLAGCFAPWLYLFITNYGSGSLAPVLEKPEVFNIILQFYEFTFGFHSDLLMATLIGSWPIFILIGFFFLSKRDPFSPLISLLLLGVFMPIAIGFVASQYMPLFLSRYFIIVTPPLFILIAWFISKLSKNARLMVGGVFLATLSILLIDQTFDPQVPTRENYREATSYISSQVGPRDIVVVSPPYLLYPVQYYYHGDATLTTYPIWDKHKGGIPNITQSLLEQDITIIKGEHKRIFFLVSMDLYGAKETKTYLDNHFTKIEKQQFSRNIWVHVYQAEYISEEDGSTTTETPEQNSANTGTAVRTHTVVKGDTLAKIAHYYYGHSTEYPRIQKANGIVNPNVIHTGGVLIIPTQ